MEEGLRFLLTLVAGDMTKSQLVVVVNQPSKVELSYQPFCSTLDPALEPDLSFKDCTEDMEGIFQRVATTSWIMRQDYSIEIAPFT